MTTGAALARRSGGAALGVVLDHLLGEPAISWHPVVHFGRLMNALERKGYLDSRARGVAYSLAGTLLGVGSGRALLPSLVGRETTSLDVTEISRAVIESVAENTVDAIVAPVLWAGVAGAPGALGYRAVNTMDAMVGHRSPRYNNFGWASARLDDVANWIPSRATAVLVALVRPRSVAVIRTAVRTQAPAHPSPNAGVAEAAFAAALGVQLGGRNRYGDHVEDRAPLGTGRPPEPSDIVRAIELSRHVTFALAGLLGLLGLATWRVAR
jgi:adenosylcobinamide-phosphate synthase